MKISLNWIKEYVSISVTADQCAKRLTMAGLEVERIEKVGADTVFELEITPNRPDCLNMIGIARELSAIFNKSLKIPAIKKPKAPKKSCPITIDDKKDCSRYIGTIITDVSVRSAPARIQRYLTALGLRCINNIVDLTNFCLLEMGQPLHAFDYDKLIGGKIIVRRAKKGEKIVAIDDNEYELDPSILVIADEKRPVAIAGIMGGKDTEVTAHTKNILLESAYFDPILIRRGARTLGLTSDSSYRFERGVDINGVEAGNSRAISLIVQEAGGRISAHADRYPSKRTSVPKKISVTADHISALLGTSLSTTRIKTILTKLGCRVTQKKIGITVVPPTFRADLKEPVDIIEEIARIIGYDNLPITVPHASVSRINAGNTRALKERVAQLLCGQGLHEVITYSLVSRQALEKSQCADTLSIAVSNPLTAEQEIMRPALLPSMMPVVCLNLNKGQKDIRIFELGKIYPPDGERETLGITMTGARATDWRQQHKEQVDFYDIKGVVDTLCAALGIDGVRYVACACGQCAHNICADIMLGKKTIGHIGAVSPAILKNWDIKHGTVFFAQIACEALFAAVTAHAGYQALSGFPSVTRDISLAVAEQVTFQEVCDIVRENGRPLLSAIRFLERYEGDKIPAGHRGLVFSLEYQSPTRTLREEEVSSVHNTICEALTLRLGAIKR